MRKIALLYKALWLISKLNSTHNITVNLLNQCHSTKGRVSQCNSNELEHILALHNLRLQCGLVFRLLAWLCFQRFPLIGRLSNDPEAGLDLRSRRAQTAACLCCFCSTITLLFPVLCVFLCRKATGDALQYQSHKKMGSLTLTILPNVLLIFVHAFYGTEDWPGKSCRAVIHFDVTTQQH